MRVRNRRKETSRPTILYLPSILTELLNECKRESGDGKVADEHGNLKIDHLAWVLYIVARNSRAGYDQDDYRPVNAKLLQSVVHEYNRCLKVLEDLGAVIRGTSYQEGVESKRAGLTRSCQTAVSAFRVTDSTTSDAIWRYFDDVAARWSYPIGRMGDDLRHLRIRGLQATSRLKRLVESGEVNRVCQKGRTRKRWHGPAVTPPEWHLARIIDVNRDKSDPTVASSNGRVFSKATNLKAEFRSDLYFDDADSTGVSSIDIVNSQPYLLSLAVRYIDPAEAVRNLGAGSNRLERMFEEVFLNQSCLISIYSGPSKLSNTHVSNFWPRGIDLKTKRFVEIASTGRFYEHLASEVSCETGENWTRDQAKEATYKILFGKVNHENRSTRAFASSYPQVWSYVNALKTSGHNGCALVLQRFEAWLMMNKVAWAFEPYPEIRYFTVHDSFVVPSSEAARAQHIINTALVGAVGESPRLVVKHH